MATTYLYRLLVICPAASKTSFNTWIRNNLDATGGDWFGGLGLSATGIAPATHFWCNAQMTGAQAQLAVQRLCTVSGVAISPNWATLTRDEKIQWVKDNRVAILAGAGNLDARAMPNDGTWDDIAAILANRGLLVIQPP